MVTQIAPITAEAFWELCQTPEYADRHIELIEGAIVEMSPTGAIHGVLTSKLGRFMGNYSDETGAGVVFGAETGFILDAHPDGGGRIVLAPDAAFIRAERLTGGIPERFFDGPPDLAVEVMSPSDSAAGMTRKAALYLEYGARAVWIVEPSSRTVTVFEARADGPAAGLLLRETDTLEGGDVLPDFRLPLSALFPPAP